METKKELLNKLNDFKGKCNLDKIRMEEFNKQIEYYSRITLPNVVNVYRDKIFELNEIFQEKGLEYFSSDCYLRVLTNIYLNIFNYKLYTELIELASKMGQYNFYALFSDKIADKLYKRRLNSIKDDIEYIDKFNINEYPEILVLILESGNLLSNLLPDCYEIFVKEIYKEMDQLGVYYSDLDRERIAKLIYYRENKSKYLLDQNRDKKLESFNKFKEEYDININSDYCTYINTLKK